MISLYWYGHLHGCKYTPGASIQRGLKYTHIYIYNTKLTLI